MEAQLKEFLDRLQPAAGSNLVSVVLYGSAATGEFRAGQSDLNILCLVNQADADALESLHAISEWWIKKGNHPPLIFTRDELARSADVFAIELLDMKSKHRILYGPDFFTDLEVPLHLHRLQVERELRTNWLRLRQAIIAAPLTEKSHLALMTNSLSLSSPSAKKCPRTNATRSRPQQTSPTPTQPLLPRTPTPPSFTSCSTCARENSTLNPSKSNR